MKTYKEWTVLDHTFRGYEDNVSDKVLVFFHGFTGNKSESGRLFYHLSDELTTAGISTIRFDWFGHGESDMEFVDIRVDMLLAQARLVLAYAHEHYREVYLLGFSMGGSFAMSQAAKDISKLILMAPAYMIGGMKSHYFKDKSSDTHDLGGLVLHKEFVDGFTTLDMLDNTKRYPNPILILQGENDQSVSKELSLALHEQLSNSQIKVFPSSDHCFHNRETHRVLAGAIQTFLTT